VLARARSHLDGNVDAAANAFTYVLLALGLNIVVGFAGLLDLGYAAFFAIGAYSYGIAASFQVQPTWSDLWTPLLWLGQVSRVHVEGQPDIVNLQFSFWGFLVIGALICAVFGVLFGAPTLRLRGDYLAIVTLGLARSCRCGGAELDGAHERGAGAGRDPDAAVLRVRLRLRRVPYTPGLAWSVTIRVRIAPGVARGRAWMASEDELGSRGDGREPGPLQAARLRDGRGDRGLGGVLRGKLTTATPTCSSSRCR
jgi:branched-chain amino acid transport system permease protein